MSAPNLIDLARFLPEGSAKQRFFQKVAQPSVDRILGVRRINALYSEAEALDADGSFDTILKAGDLRYTIARGSIESIPQTGPVIVVANHPFGGVDGIILGDILEKRRSDSKLMGNFLLKHIPLISDRIIAVDPFGGDNAKRANLKGLKASYAHLAAGSCLGAFPAGIVAHASGKSLQAKEQDWHVSLARLAQKTGATVVPVHFSGANSPLFQLSGHIHSRLRTAFLMREFNRLTGSTLTVSIGKAIQPSLSAHYPDPAQLIRFYQLRSEVLRHSEADSALKQPLLPELPQQPLAERRDTALFLSEIEQLPAENRLIDRGTFQVYYANAGQIPHLLHEIGRTRELTFRPVGEGTGKSVDLDRYDESYDHLFLWNNETCEVVGAYRLGKVDEIIGKDGFAGLYSSTIFDYADDAFATLGKTLELGRSYIVPEYQKKGASLFLLWKGVIAYAGRNPGYRKLFGAVSISDDYTSLSKGLILQFLRRHKMLQGFEKKIRARKKPSFEKLRSLQNFDYPDALPRIDSVSSLVEEIEPDSKGVPTLLKHYLQLNGVILGFGVDQSFNDALDGFIMVDLDQVNPKLLAKYQEKPRKTSVPSS